MNRAAFVARNALGASGETLPRYAEYFPKLNPVYYKGASEAVCDSVLMQSDVSFSMSDFVFWMSMDGIDAQLFDQANSAAIQAAANYALWEVKQAQSAEQWQLMTEPMPDGGMLIAAFQGDEVLYADQLQAWWLEEINSVLSRIIPILFVLFTLLMALWVFLDARRRAFKPALWGALTLIGNIVGWVVYMMVRPYQVTASACPSCDSALRADYVVCPQCGQALKATCAACGRAMEPGWNVCPYCAKWVERSEAQG